MKRAEETGGGNSSLHSAKRAKNDEFYTQYPDIQREINAYLEYDPDLFRGKTVLLPCDDPEWSNFTKFFAQNFDALGLRKLISTSYALNSKQYKYPKPPSLFEQESPKYNPTKSDTNGKIFILDRDRNNDGNIDFDDLDWDYLEGDGDFRSKEVTRLRDEADFVITNPPFSLFREFLAWLVEGGKQFAVIGNMNAITYKEVFPMIKENKLWYGSSIHSGDREFGVPDYYPLDAAGWRVDKDGNKFIRVKGVRWFTNIEHGRRHQPLQLMTMEDNLKYGSKKIREQGYPKYDNYDAIEVAETAAIPSDYDGVMGVPISFLDKYCPEQFEIVNANDFRTNETVPIKAHGLIKDKEATITRERERERERERDEDNVRSNLHQTNCWRQELTDGTSMERESMHVSLSASYYDMVARPKVNGVNVYRRIFVKKKSHI